MKILTLVCLAVTVLEGTPIPCGQQRTATGSTATSSTLTVLVVTAPPPAATNPPISNVPPQGRRKRNADPPPPPPLDAKSKVGIHDAVNQLASRLSNKNAAGTVQHEHSGLSPYLVTPGSHSHGMLGLAHSSSQHNSANSATDYGSQYSTHGKTVTQSESNSQKNHALLQQSGVKKAHVESGADHGLRMVGASKVKSDLDLTHGAHHGVVTKNEGKDLHRASGHGATIEQHVAQTTKSGAKATGHLQHGLSVEAAGAHGLQHHGTNTDSHRSALEAGGHGTGTATEISKAVSQGIKTGAVAGGHGVKHGIGMATDMSKAASQGMTTGAVAGGHGVKHGIGMATDMSKAASQGMTTGAVAGGHGVKHGIGMATDMSKAASQGMTTGAVAGGQGVKHGIGMGKAASQGMTTGAVAGGHGVKHGTGMATDMSKAASQGMTTGSVAGGQGVKHGIGMATETSKAAFASSQVIKPGHSVGEIVNLKSIPKVEGKAKAEINIKKD